MKIIADTHTHTIASTHAYSTLLEMMAAAKEKGLVAIAMTDHGIGMPDSPHYWHFSNMRMLPETINGVHLIKGTEANIMDLNGNLDFSFDQLKRMQWVIASFHETVLSPGTKENQTNALINALKNPYIDVFGHMGNPNFSFDYESIISRCNEYHKIFEINAASYVVRRGSESNCREIALLCKKYEVPIIVNSDAHISLDVGNFEKPVEMLEEIDFPEHLIMNAEENRFFNMLEQHIGFKKNRT